VFSFLGYLIAPDDSPSANRQLIEAARLPPGSHVRVVALHTLHVPPPPVPVWQVWWSGRPDPYRYEVLAPDSPALPTLGATERPPVSDTVCYRTVSGLDKCLRAGDLAHERTLRFPLGTDALGRCVASRLILGARVSLGIGLLAVAVSLLLGGLLGAVAGYLGGWWDGAAQWLMAVVWAVPSLLLAVALAYVLGRGMAPLVLAIGLATWVDLARVLRGRVLSLRQELFIEAARSLGLPTHRLVWHHLLPNLTGPLLILSCANFATAILLEAGLSFLGLGVPPPTPSWGRMIFEGYPYLMFSRGQWLALLPGGAIVLLIIALNLTLIGLRDALQPARGHQAG
jgi:peptide/nickel transport system permease protein